MRVNLRASTIPEDEKTPLVLQLLAVIEQQAEQIQQLKDEIARLKNHPSMPDIKPSSLEKKNKRKSRSSRKKRPGSKKRSKTAELKIHKDRFHLEKERILAVGLQVSSYINVDDTGARHKGKNGYCTHIGNEYFSWFESTESKSRINFLKLMRAGSSDFVINMDAICYMQSNKLPQKPLEAIIENKGMIFANDAQWDAFLTDNGIVKDRHVRIATEGVLIGTIIERGISKHLVIVSDDAGQFNVLLHALCWIHANRAIDKVIAFTDQAKKDLDTVKDQVWLLYEGLKKYKQNPKLKAKKRLEDMFDNIFSSKTASATLNTVLKRIYNNKSELLLVLDRPDIPLHNNGAENAIREYVKKRKISGSTRSETGRRCRDTFTSLKKTCRKLGVSFWQYLKDRIEKIGIIPDLSELVRQHSLNPG
jgi:hypothetical protein